MSDSCCSGKAASQQLACPGCGGSAATVPAVTLQHQLTQPWRLHLDADHFFFCEQTGCDVVYFSAGGTVFHTDALRQPVGQKSTRQDRMLCYCFDIRYSDLADAETARKCRDYVINETRADHCACEQRNPSGRCCLRDFPKMEEER